MSSTLMPKGSAVWLIENTSLTFDQIADFCGLHPLEIKGIADGEVAGGIVGVSPVTSGELTLEEIKRCEADPKAKLIGHRTEYQFKRKKAKYTPVARRGDKPDAVAWLVKNCPELKDVHIVKLVGTTKQTINSIRLRTHWNIQNIRPRDPVLLGICGQMELDAMLAKAKLETEGKEEHKGE